MKYNVFNYSNQLIGKVEANDAIDAWSRARKEFDGQNILDVREVIGEFSSTKGYGEKSVYYYNSINDVGEARVGYIVADSEDEAIYKLQKQWDREVMILGNRPMRLIKIESVSERAKIREVLAAEEKRTWERGEEMSEEFRRGIF